MKILVVDGQGGKIGAALVELLLKKLPEEAELLAVGTNSLATLAMKKAGAQMIATGDNAIIFNAGQADVIVGSIGIIAANSIMGELSPAVANAIATSEAEKVLIPVGKCKFKVVGSENIALPQKIENAVELVLSLIK